MKVLLKTTAIAAATAAASLMSTQAAAEVEANIGVASNYIWRGLTQTSDQAAVSGGLDYSNNSFYAGTWASNVDFSGLGDGYELDGYLGYAGEFNGFGYDVGYIYYAYPAIDEADFSEVYIGGSYGIFSLMANFQVDADFTNEDYVYITAGLDFDLGGDYGLGLYVGDYDFGDDGDGYTHYGASLSKGDFAIAIDKNDIDTLPGDNTDDPRVTVSWSKTF